MSDTEQAEEEEVQPTEKLCSRCKETKPLTAFTVDKARADGLRIYCAVCSREAVKQSMERHPERVKERARMENRVRYQASKRLRELHPEEFKGLLIDERAKAKAKRAEE